MMSDKKDDGSFSEGSASYYSDEGDYSQYSDERSGGDRSYDSGSQGSRSYYSDEEGGGGSQDGSRSYYSDEEGDGRSFRSDDDGSASYRSGSQSQYSDHSRSYEGSQGSYRSGDDDRSAGTYGSRSFVGSQEGSRGSFEDDRSASAGSYGSRSFEGSQEGSMGSYNSGSFEGEESANGGSKQQPTGMQKTANTNPPEGDNDSKEGSLELSEAFAPSDDEESYSSEPPPEENSLSLSQAFSQRSGSASESGSDEYSRSYDDENSQSYEGSEGSYRSGEDGSYRSGEGSYRSGEGSYRSDEGSYKSGEESYDSQRSGSYHSQSQQSGSFASEGGSFAEEDSRRSGSLEASASMREEDLDASKETTNSASKSSNYDSFANDSAPQLGSQQIPSSMLPDKNDGTPEDEVNEDGSYHSSEYSGSASERSFSEESGGGGDSEKGDSRQSLNVSDIEGNSGATRKGDKTNIQPDTHTSSIAGSSGFSFAQDSNVAASQTSFGASFADDTTDSAEQSRGMAPGDGANNVHNSQSNESFLGNKQEDNIGSDDENFNSFAEFSHHSENEGGDPEPMEAGSDAEDGQLSGTEDEVSKEGEGSIDGSYDSHPEDHSERSGASGVSDDFKSENSFGSVDTGDGEDISNPSDAENSVPMNNNAAGSSSLGKESGEGIDESGSLDSFGGADDVSDGPVNESDNESNLSKVGGGSEGSVQAGDNLSLGEVGSFGGAGELGSIASNGSGLLDTNSDAQQPGILQQPCASEAENRAGGDAPAGPSTTSEDEFALEFDDDFDLDALDAGSLGSVDDLDASGLGSFESDFSDHDAEEMLLELDDQDLSEGDLDDLGDGDTMEDIQQSESIGKSVNESSLQVTTDEASKQESSPTPPELGKSEDGRKPAVPAIEDIGDGLSADSKGKLDSESLASAEGHGTASGGNEHSSVGVSEETDEHDNETTRSSEPDQEADDSFATGDFSDDGGGSGTGSQALDEGSFDEGSQENSEGDLASGSARDSVDTSFREGDDSFEGESPAPSKGTTAAFEGETTPGSSMPSTLSLGSEGSEEDVQSAASEEDGSNSYDSQGESVEPDEGSYEEGDHEGSVISGSGSYSDEGSIDEDGGSFDDDGDGIEDSFPSLVTNRTDDVQSTVNDSFPSLVSHSVADDTRAGADEGDEGSDEGSDEKSLSASAVFREEDEESVSEGEHTNEEEDENSLSASEIFGGSNSGSGSYTDEGSHDDEGSFEEGEEEGSYEGGSLDEEDDEGSYISNDGGSLDDEGSYEENEDASYISGEEEGSFQSKDEEGSFEGSLDENEDGSFVSGDYDEEGSYVSGEGGSLDEGEDDGSYISNDGGSLDEEGSFDEEGEAASYVSGEEDGSYRSQDEEGSFEGGSLDENEDASYVSGDDEEGSYVSGEGSYVSGEGSYVSGEGSYVSGEGSYVSGEGSYVSGEGSYVSGEEGSYVSGEEGSYVSGEEGSYVSGSQSYTDEGSYDSQYSGEGSYSGSYSDEEGLTYDMGYRSDPLNKSPGSYDESALESIIEENSDDERSSAEDNDSSRSGSHSGSRSGSASIDLENDDYSGSQSYDENEDYSGSYDENEDYSGSYDENEDYSGSYDDEGYDDEGYDDEGYDDDEYGDSEYGDDSYDDEYDDYDDEYDDGDGEGSFFPDASLDGTGYKDRGGQFDVIEEGDEEGSEMEEKPKKRKKKKKKKKKKNRPKVNVRSEALLELVANVNDAMLELEEEENRSDYDQEANLDSSARRLLLGFEALLGILLALSDELELVSTFATKKDTIAIDALQAVLSFAPELDHVFSQLKPILQDFLYEEPDEEMDDLLYRLNSLMDLLVESTHRVGERHEWNPRAETAYVTLLEMLERDTLEVTCLDDGMEVPEYPLSGHLEEAWTETGHEEEFKTLDVTDDIWMFRQVCYEVLVSTDQWCPDTRVLMDICGIDPADIDDPDRIEPDDFELAPVPDAAKQVLEKVHGDPLPRKSVMASILRRILPPRAITDTSLLDSFASIRNTIRNPRGLSATNLVAVSSVPEVFTDPDSLGVDGVGKTTLAAMVAHHADVRRFFLDGVIWIYIGQMELNYTRYTQCLRELLAQLYLEDDEQVPMFPDLIHTPGESKAKRRRREEGFMLHVRETIADFLQYRDVLIILDDICYEADLDWFDFAPIQSENPGEEFTFALLVTTRCRYLLPAADTVEIDMLEEADAIQLLIQESGENLSQTLMAESPEARSVVRECANHPLAVKSVGRWLNLKHATAGVVSSVEEIHEDVVKSMDKILKNGDQEDADMMYEILNMSLSPAINGEPTNIIKFCFSAFVVVFCDRQHISEFALIEDFPMVPMPMAELFFESLLELEENTLLKEGDLFYAQKKEAAVLIPEALSALGVLKVIATYSEPPEEEGGENPPENQGEEKYLQVMHSIQQEYGESLCRDDGSLRELTKDAEQRWNNAFAEAFLAVERDWDSEFPDAALDYALEMLPSHMIRGGMYSAAADLLAHSGFVRGRLFLLGRENATRRHIKDCEHLFNVMPDVKRGKKKKDRKAIMNKCYFTLGKQLDMDEDENGPEDNRVKGVEVGRAHYDIGFSLADKECWEAAIEHWEKSQELLVSSIGMVEIVAAILFNVGVVYAEMSDYERSLGSLKQCLRIRGALHGEDHLLYAQTIQKIGDVFLMMSDYHEAMESYNWALDVMHIEPSLHRVDIGDIQENLGNIHYSKGEIDEALQCFQEALKSKQADLGEEHPELATIFHHIGNCLADQDSRFEAIDHFEQAIQLKEIDPDGGPERDADVLTIEGVLSSISGRQEEGLECYEKALNILVTKVPHQKEKVASLLHLIGCMYLMFGQHKKAMKLFEESLQARRKVLGYVHLDVASTLYNMAFLHQNRGRLDKALKCLEEALKIRKLRLPESEKVAITYEKIGKFAREMGKTTKAQNALEEALTIRKKVHGGTHEAVATVLQELGDLMDDNANYKDAMDKYFEALDIRQNLFGNDHVAVAETFYSMGYTLQNQDSLDQALDCFEESLNIRKVQLGLDAKEVGDTLNMMGFLQAKRGELDDALSLLWDALRIRKLQEDHVKVSETLKNIGNVHREKAEHELAIECYEECLRIRRSELGDVHEKVADALIAMGNVQSDMELAEEAMRSYREALTIRTYFFGEHDDSVGAVLQKMGSLEFQNGEYEKALSMLTEFIRIRQENDSENDGDYVNVLFMIGNIHKMQGNEDEAKKWWTDAYDVFQELGLSEGNPQVAQVMDNLLRQENIGQREEHQQQKQGFFGGLVDKVTAAIEDQLPNSGQRLGGANY